MANKFEVGELMTAVAAAVDSPLDQRGDIEATGLSDDQIYYLEHEAKTIATDGDRFTIISNP